MKRAILILTLGVFAACWSATTASAAAPAPLWKTCLTSPGTGPCEGPDATSAPVAIATSPVTGDVYVVVQQEGRYRVDELSAWGEFRMAFGWGVRDGSPEPQTCGPAASPPSATCLEGLAGGGPGQFSSVGGIAVDSHGNLYIQEASGGVNCSEGPCHYTGNNRVQKFDAAGDFLLAYGREVNLTKVDLREEEEANAEPVTVTSEEEDLCTAASGDTCGPGTRGSGDGEFGVGPNSPREVEPLGDHIAVGPGDVVYVGGEGRVQKFEADGTFLESVPMPVGEAVSSLAVNPAGDLYASFFDESVPFYKVREDVDKYGPAGASEALCTAAVPHPMAFAADPSGLYVVDGENRFGSPFPEQQVHLRRFDDGCAEDPSFDFTDGFEIATGIATGSACGIPGADLYVSNTSRPNESTGIRNNYVRAYGPHPDPAVCAPPTVPPTIGAQYTISVETTTATLRAEINPHFWEPPLPGTSFQIEYGTARCTEGDCLKTAPRSLGAGVVGHATPTPPATLSGLAAGTTYHYRFVAEGGGGGPVMGPEMTFRTFDRPLPERADCPNHALRAGLSTRLPDCRAFEMVSPVDKNGGDVRFGQLDKRFGAEPFLPHDVVAADGERATYSTLIAFADPEAAPVPTQILSSRTPSGWRTRAISPPRKVPTLIPPGVPSFFRYFSEDLCRAWLVQDTDIALVPGAPRRVPNLYLQRNCGEAPRYELLTPVQPPGGFEEQPEPDFYLSVANVSADEDHAVFGADAPLTPGACPTTRIFQVYESSPGGGLHLISELPDGTPNCTHASAGLFVMPGERFLASSEFNVVSTDGEVVFWSAGASATPVDHDQSTARIDEPKLYVRIHALRAPSAVVGGKCVEPSKACTLSVSDEAKGSIFVAADPSGRRALYRVTKNGLTNEAGELREYDLGSRESRPIAPDVIGVAGASEDLSRIYFTSADVLSGAQRNSAGDEARAGEPNLYLYDRGSEGITFVATLSQSEAGPNVGGGNPSAPAASEPWVRTSRVSPDGMHLAFTSEEPLTGADNTDVRSGKPDVQVFLYDADPGGGPGSLACVSCNPTGARPTGAGLGSQGDSWVAGLIPGWPDQMRPSRILASDGSYLFFESYDRLVPGDRNARRDVYEWRRAGGPTECARRGAESYVAAAGGCVSLLSGGQDATDAVLLGAGSTGRDVFFTTGASLVSQDPGAIDVYDAREGGGFPAPPAPAAPCDVDVEGSCQGPPGAAPASPGPGSAIRGPGNVAPVRGCAKGKHRGKGKHQAMGRHHGKGKRQAKSRQRRKGGGKRHGKRACVKRHGHTRRVHHRHGQGGQTHHKHGRAAR